MTTDWGPYRVDVAEVRPPELARLFDLAERPRAGGWSMRAALTRYGQPQAQRASDLTEVLRRVDGALKPQVKTAEREGPALWAALSAALSATEEEGADHLDLVRLLRVAADLDRLGDRLATWALDIRGPRPDEEADAAVDELGGQLDSLGVPREQAPPRMLRRRGV
ncbi:MAG: hypothetical protein JWO77_3466 [Ilumatobacteraceae bacterium]|nr:hypothetical protein [Ilumatobacteraceae bacterium]